MKNETKLWAEEQAERLECEMDILHDQLKDHEHNKEYHIREAAKLVEQIEKNNIIIQDLYKISP